MKQYNVSEVGCAISSDFVAWLVGFGSRIFYEQ